MLSGIIRGRATSCCSLGVRTSAVRGLFNAASAWAVSCVTTIMKQRNGVPKQMSAQTETRSGKSMRIKDVRQRLHTLVHTQGLDGLLHLYKRLERRGRALLLCLLCAEAGWLILVNAWGCGSNAPTLSCACFCECNLQQPKTKMGRSAMRCCIIPIAAHRPTRLRRTGTIPSTASIF